MIIVDKHLCTHTHTFMYSYKFKHEYKKRVKSLMRVTHYKQQQQQLCESVFSSLLSPNTRLHHYTNTCGVGEKTTKTSNRERLYKQTYTQTFLHTFYKQVDRLVFFLHSFVSVFFSIVMVFVFVII